MNNSTLKPVSKGERFEILDILRGFALYGVFMANMVWFFSGYGEVDSKVSAEFPTARLDAIMLEVESFFVVNKFVTIFSFLFGIGFAVQLKRVTERGKKFTAFYVRRMFWLFVFGVLHFTFLLYTDILHLYALLGLFLIFWGSLSNRQLVFWGVSFTLLFPVLILSFIWGFPALFGEAFNIERIIEERWNTAARHHSVFIDGSYLEVIRANLADVWAWLTTDDALTTGIRSFGLFLLGYWVGRSELLSRINYGLSVGDRLNFRSVLLTGLIVGLVCQGLLLLNIQIIMNENLWWVRVVREVLWRSGVFALSLFYVCSIVMLYQHKYYSRLLNLFAPVGRMALTNYIGQSIICIFIFYGFGLALYGQVGPTITIILTTIIFAFQMAISWWWLKLFHFGPVEWAWRSLTYGQMVRFRISK